MCNLQIQIINFFHFQLLEFIQSIPRIHTPNIIISYIITWGLIIKTASYFLNPRKRNSIFLTLIISRFQRIIIQALRSLRPRINPHNSIRSLWPDRITPKVSVNSISSIRPITGNTRRILTSFPTDRDTAIIKVCVLKVTDVREWILVH